MEMADYRSILLQNGLKDLIISTLTVNCGSFKDTQNYRGWIICSICYTLSCSAQATLSMDCMRTPSSINAARQRHSSTDVGYNHNHGLLATTSAYTYTRQAALDSPMLQMIAEARFRIPETLYGLYNVLDLLLSSKYYSDVFPSTKNTTITTCPK